MIKTVVFSTLFATCAAILQSTLLSHVAIYHAVPDLALCVIVYTAYEYGVMTGQLSGFFSGLLLDFLSASPLGMHILIFTVIGAAGGLLRGTFVLDTFFLPMLLAAGATLSKALFLFILHLLFAGELPAYSLSAPTLWIELALNVFCTPFLFALLKLSTRIIRKRTKGLSSV
jgi:rod shape-determining protein MreD